MTIAFRFLWLFRVKEPQDPPPAIPPPPTPQIQKAATEAPILVDTEAIAKRGSEIKKAHTPSDAIGHDSNSPASPSPRNETEIKKAHRPSDAIGYDSNPPASPSPAVAASPLEVAAGSDAGSLLKSTDVKKEEITVGESVSGTVTASSIPQRPAVISYANAAKKKKDVPVPKADASVDLGKLSPQAPPPLLPEVHKPSAAPPPTPDVDGNATPVVPKPLPGVITSASAEPSLPQHIPAKPDTKTVAPTPPAPTPEPTPAPEDSEWITPSYGKGRKSNNQQRKKESPHPAKKPTLTPKNAFELLESTAHSEDSAEVAAASSEPQTVAPAEIEHSPKDAEPGQVTPSPPPPDHTDQDAKPESATLGDKKRKDKQQRGQRAKPMPIRAIRFDALEVEEMEEEEEAVIEEDEDESIIELLTALFNRRPIKEHALKHFKIQTTRKNSGNRNDGKTLKGLKDSILELEKSEEKGQHCVPNLEYVLHYAAMCL